jgi:methanogenic corrinoid protein MtbC1
VELEPTAERIVNEGAFANVALDKMMKVMHTVGEKYERKENFTVYAAAALTATRESIKVPKPHLKVKPANIGGKIVVG